MQTYLKTRPAIIQFMLFMGLALGLVSIFFYIGQHFLTQMTGITADQAQDMDTTKPGMITYVRGLLLVQFLGLFLLPSLLFAYFSDPEPKQYLGLRPPHSAGYWVLGVAALLAAIPFVELLGVLNQKMIVGAGAQKWVKEMEEDAARQIRFMLARHTPEELLKNLVFIALFAGVGEELFFRGILQRLFIRITRSPWLGIVITAVLFSAIHMQFLGFFPRVFLGVLLGVIYWYSGSLWPAILAHFLYDGLIIVVLYLNPQMMENPNAPLVKASQLIPMGLVSAAATGFLVWLMVKRSSSRFDQVYKDDFPPTDQLSF